MSSFHEQGDSRAPVITRPPRLPSLALPCPLNKEASGARPRTFCPIWVLVASRLLFLWAPSQLPPSEMRLCSRLVLLPHSWNDNSSQNLWGVCVGGSWGSGEAARMEQVNVTALDKELGHLTSG